MSDDDGGPVYPYPSLEAVTITHNGIKTTQEGMAWRQGNLSVRDWLVGQALAGIADCIIMNTRTAHGSRYDYNETKVSKTVDIAEAIADEYLRRRK